MGFIRGGKRVVDVGNRLVEEDEINRILAEFMPYVEDRDVVLDTMVKVYNWSSYKGSLNTLSRRLKAIRAGFRDLGYSNIPFKRYTKLTDVRDEGGIDYE